MTWVRSGNRATLSSSFRASSSGAGWVKTGRAKVASVTKTSQVTGSKGGQVGSARRL